MIKKIKLLLENLEKNLLEVIDVLNIIKRLIGKADVCLSQDQIEEMSSLMGEINIKKYNIEIYLQSMLEKIDNMRIENKEI